MAALTQGLEDGGSFSGGADGLQVRWQGLVVARGGQDILGLQLGAGCPLPLQVTQFLHGIQLDPEALVLVGRKEGVKTWTGRPWFLRPHKISPFSRKIRATSERQPGRWEVVSDTSHPCVTGPQYLVSEAMEHSGLRHGLWRLADPWFKSQLFLTSYLSPPHSEPHLTDRSNYVPSSPGAWYPGHTPKLGDLL